MAYSVNWISKVLTVPTSDLTLVSGTRYKLLMSAFLAECRRLEWAFTEGLWAPPILDHSNTRVDFAGVDYAPFDEVVNGYTVQVTGAATRVDLIGSNNNVIDVLIATGVSVVPNNSAGLQIVATGSGVTAQDKIDIANQNWATILEGTMTAADMMMLKFAVTCGMARDADTHGPVGPNTTSIEFMGADGTTARVVSTADIHKIGGRSSVVWDAT